MARLAVPPPTILLDARAIDRTLRRMADEIVELHDGVDGLVLVGIQRRGVQLAARIAGLIAEREGESPRRGALDITLYRDDLQTIGPRPIVGPTDIPWDIDGARVVIVDDVLYTGRTVRAVDRGGRELPIHADVVGKRIELRPDQRVDVLVDELDGRDAVVVVPKGAPPAEPDKKGGRGPSRPAAEEASA